jgi:three-Cys-motif partner protein
MNAFHQFGGRWTDKKLELVHKYLQAYTIIFNKNPNAQKLHTIYLDAFAGTGYRNSHPAHDENLLLELGEEETQDFLKGSARIALEVDPPFREYVFIENDPEYANELETLRVEFSTSRPNIQIRNENANTYLQTWLMHTNWRATRAVVFLDPYGMQVDWNIIELIGQTKSIDLWLLFPLGVAVNRLLTKSAPPRRKCADALTRIFGTDEWQQAFYPRKKQLTLFGEEEVHPKQAKFEDIGHFFLYRLQNVFTAVAPNPFVLTNSKNNPLYWLYFASGNPKGAPTAVKIAKDILGKG